MQRVANSIPGRGVKISYALWPKHQNIKQEQYCNKFRRLFKGSTSKGEKRKKERKSQSNCWAGSNGGGAGSCLLRRSQEAWRQIQWTLRHAWSALDTLSRGTCPCNASPQENSKEGRKENKWSDLERAREVKVSLGTQSMRQCKAARSTEGLNHLHEREIGMQFSPSAPSRLKGRQGERQREQLPEAGCNPNYGESCL